MAQHSRPGLADEVSEKETRQITRTSVYLKPGEKRKSKKMLAERRADEKAEVSVLDRAVEVIGGKDEAMRWMGTPVRALDYATPVSLLGDRKGREAILTVLGRLEHGVM